MVSTRLVLDCARWVVQEGFEEVKFGIWVKDRGDSGCAGEYATEGSGW